MTIGTMNLCSLVSVYIFLWGIVMDQLREGYNAVITESGWRAMLCNSDRRRKNPFSLCLQYFLFVKKENPPECLGAVKHWFNDLWCHQHAQRGTLAHTQTRPDRTPAEVSLESTSLRTWSMLPSRPEPSQDFQKTLMSSGGGQARRRGDSYLACRPSDFKKAFVGCHAELPSPHASVELCTYTFPFFSSSCSNSENIFL